MQNQTTKDTEQDSVVSSINSSRAPAMPAPATCIVEFNALAPMKELLASSMTDHIYLPTVLPAAASKPAETRMRFGANSLAIVDQQVLKGRHVVCVAHAHCCPGHIDGVPLPRSFANFTVLASSWVELYCKPYKRLVYC